MKKRVLLLILLLFLYFSLPIVYGVEAKITRSMCSLQDCVVKRFSRRNFALLQQEIFPFSAGGCDSFSVVTDLRQYKLSTPLCCCRAQLTDAQLYQKILGFQSEIQANNDIFPPSGIEGFRAIKGTRKVLLSAPHATRHVREGSTKVADYCTGAIARAVTELTGATIIYTTHKSALDPNFYDFADGTTIPYKQNIAALASETPFIILLDIHGASETQPFDVDFGTMFGKSLLGKDDLLVQLKNSLTAKGIASLSSDFFAAEQHQTVTKFASSKNIPAVQLEINKKFRCQTEADTVKLVRALESFIRSI